MGRQSKWLCAITLYRALVDGLVFKGRLLFKDRLIIGRLLRFLFRAVSCALGSGYNPQICNEDFKDRL